MKCFVPVLDIEATVKANNQDRRLLAYYKVVGCNENITFLNQHR